MPPYTPRPMCSTKEPNSRGSATPMGSPTVTVTRVGAAPSLSCVDGDCCTEDSISSVKQFGHYSRRFRNVKLGWPRRIIALSLDESLFGGHDGVRDRVVHR